MHKRPRSHRILWALGLLLMVGTALGAGWVLNNGQDKDSPGDAEPARAPVAPPAGVVCVGHVDVEPRVADLVPHQPGEVVEVIAEGKEVKKGHVLLRLDPKRAEAKVKQAEAEVRIAEEKLAKAKHAPRLLKHQVQEQEAAVRAAKAQKGIAVKELKRVSDNYEVRQANLSEKQAAEEAVKKAQAVVEGQEAKLRQLEVLDAEEDIRQAEENVKLKEAQLAEAKLTLRDCELRAPSNGLVLRVFISPGEMFGPQAKLPAIQFAPSGPRIVRAEVLQEWADRVKPGQEVTIEDDTRGGARWAGKVRRLSEWYTQRRITIREPFEQNDVRTLECIVDVRPEDARHLRIGQRVRVTIQAGG